MNGRGGTTAEIAPGDAGRAASAGNVFPVNVDHRRSIMHIVRFEEFIVHKQVNIITQRHLRASPAAPRHWSLTGEIRWLPWRRFTFIRGHVRIVIVVIVAVAVDRWGRLWLVEGLLMVPIGSRFVVPRHGGLPRRHGGFGGEWCRSWRGRSTSTAAEVQTNFLRQRHWLHLRADIKRHYFIR